MKLTIHVTADGAKRLLIVGSVLIVLGTAAVSLATVPHSFGQNQVLTHTDLNDNFNSLDSRVTALESSGKAVTVTVNGTSRSYSRAAVYAGATPPQYYGDMRTSTSGSGPTGYVGAKTICENLVKTKTAHMCTADELIRSAQLGKTIPNGWYATGVQDAQNVAQDCRGWTSNDSVQGTKGALWTGVFPSAQSCGVTASVLCCD